MSSPFVDGVKEILEAETGDKFVLKSGPDLLHKERWGWFLHLPLEGQSNGWIDVAYQKDDMVTLQTPSLFDTRRRIEYAYPKMRGRKRLQKASGDFHRKNVRAEYAKTVPAIVAFYDELDRIVEEVNQKHSSSIGIVNDLGAIYAQIRLPTAEVEKGAKLRQSIDAIKEFDSGIMKWLREEYPKRADQGVG